jgi:hypothetical protein
VKRMQYVLTYLRHTNVVAILATLKDLMANALKVGVCKGRIRRRTLHVPNLANVVYIVANSHT